MGKERSEKKDRYFALHHYMLKTDAWRALSAPARVVYLQIGLRYDGFNNGRIAMSVRDAASECGLAKDTANRAFKELVDLGFIEETRHGGLSRKTRIASEWRMTAFKCDLTGAFKSVLFMQRGEVARSHRMPRSRPQTGRREAERLSQNANEPVPNDARECPKRRYSLSQSTLDNSPECPKRRPVEAVFGGPPVSNDGTHIIYQSVVGSDPTPLRPPLAPAVGGSTPADGLPLECPTDRPDGLKLVWRAPVVCEMAGAEAILRRNEINAADRNAQVADPVRLATIH
jgi:hypothetical protein